MIVPNRIEDQEKAAPHSAKTTPVFQGHYGWGDSLFYMLLWGDMCQDRNIHLHDVDLLKDGGAMIGSLDAEGMEAEEINAIDTEITLKNRIANIAIDLNGNQSELFVEGGFNEDLPLNDGDWFDFDF